MIFMTNELEGRRVAFLVANEGMEEVEFTEPWKAVTDAGGLPELLAPEAGTAQAFNHLDKAGTFPVDRAIGDADPADYDALVLPGGVANRTAADNTSRSAVRPRTVPGGQAAWFR